MRKGLENEPAPRDQQTVDRFMNENQAILERLAR